ncbi:pseudouridine synthase [Paucibacter sp. PLA-PC-4]|uniref:pseudouridine synthase n=1 Tax=Paucibacter sp. PLA-PC-4 TaxID=2993655 RepID=UPI0022494029|nr:pseudouridine synthase [Paucibacter sp. PLA-PC-4]MCX2862170.1 pseudouridine synthase [Paucibacter sp. PLA-PC-4]
MSRPPKPELPLLDGVSASALALGLGPWASLLDCLAERLPLVSRDEWRARMAAGQVLDEQGHALPPETTYRAGRRIFYYRQLPDEPDIPFAETVLFQDEHLLVADKPHFLPVTPKGRYVQQTLLTRLKKRSGIATLTPIHRIDRETAGLCLFAVRPQDRDAYQRLFRERAVEKVYEAIAGFRPELPLPMTYRSRLQQRADAFMQMEEVAGEPNAETDIAMIERLGRDLARYELRPRTGQKHQLRAQMSMLNLPLLGDRIYPLLQADTTVPDYTQPLQLLAREVAFTDPLDGRPRRFSSHLRLAATTAG